MISNIDKDLLKAFVELAKKSSTVTKVKIKDNKN
jgi:hypothetical protein